jgi:hypothetical protein
VTGPSAPLPHKGSLDNTVKELVAESGLTFTDRGIHMLRGLPGEWWLFTPDWPEASAPTSNAPSKVALIGFRGLS